jgi:hypothetical protein
MNIVQKNPLFALGQIVATPGAMDAMQELNILASSLLSRHQSGDWGDLDDEDKQSNNEALQFGSRIFSSYKISDVKIWVITEWDRSVTTLLLPEDY